MGVRERWGLLWWWVCLRRVGRLVSSVVERTRCCGRNLGVKMNGRRMLSYNDDVPLLLAYNLYV
jgi:hypothetical protein